MADWTYKPPSMVYKNTSFIIEDGMIDFFGYIAFDFDRLVTTFRTWWSLVRNLRSITSCLFLTILVQDSIQSISRPKVLQMVMILS